MKIKVYDYRKTIVYDLDLPSRLSIIRGDGATGKSTLVRLIDTYNRGGAVVVESEYSIVHVDHMVLSRKMELSPNDVYIMDEYDGIRNSKVAKVLNDPRYRFIIISRDDSLPNVAYGPSNIYELHRSGRYTTVVNVYKEINNPSKVNMNNFKNIITEDSGSGFQFYKSLKGFDVRTANGNSNMRKSVLNNSIVVFDELTFGPYIKSFVEYTSNMNIWCIYPKSFEWMLLVSGIFKIDNLDAKINDSNTDLVVTYSTGTEEHAITKVLADICKDHNIRYTKSELNEFFLKDPQYTKIMNTIKQLFDIDLIELNNSRKEKSGYLGGPLIDWGM